jgi:predicted transcriptional regulator
MFAEFMRFLGLTQPAGSDYVSDTLCDITLRNFDTTAEEPYATLAAALQKALQARGVRFTDDSTEECLLDWKILGGSKLRLEVAAKLCGILITTTGREGIPFREEVDFDIQDTFRFNEDKKTLLFFERAGEKLAAGFEVRYLRDLGR